MKNAAAESLRLRVTFTKVVLAALLVTMQCGCWGGSYRIHHSAASNVTLVAYPGTFDSLHGGNLAEARRVLEAKMLKTPKDPELNYALGCVDLMQSNELPKGDSRKAMQARGWQHVEAASGKFYPADELLSHAYLVGRWGKRRDDDLYAKHVTLSSEGFSSQGGKANEGKLIKRTWILLTPP
ncbi:hypothetical protein [Roseimicrobium sp. ORNL1]|uniref:hypothetical protein n=1 Tax=Roseimicrobium sp. ORNL1 TaxID=2711231 RepID=UPI00198107E1|nr:hypothetical protein [Roseimicrobium sp. ORNL1]